jgi:succinate dehydrogenase / fumarate reductase, cytochrome b subunit
MKGQPPLTGTHHFWLRRIHSLLGVLPIGVYLIFHLTANYFAVFGPEAYDIPIKTMESFPFTIFLEFGVIYLPLLFHVLLGFKMMASSTTNHLQYSYGRNWAYMLQRLSGIILVFFIGWHMWETRIAKALYGTEISFSLMVTILDSVWAKSLYILGVAAACYHFANGLTTFCITWGITIGPQSQKAALVVFYAMGMGLFIMGMMSIFSFTPEALSGG